MSAGISVGHISRSRFIGSAGKCIYYFHRYCFLLFESGFWEGPGHIQAGAWDFTSLESSATSQSIQLSWENTTRAQCCCSIVEHSKGASRVLSDSSSLCHAEVGCLCSVPSYMVPIRAVRFELWFPTCGMGNRGSLAATGWWWHTSGVMCMTELRKLCGWELGLWTQTIWVWFLSPSFLTLWPWAGV